MLEANGPIDARGPEIIHRVGLIGGEVKAAVEPKPQLFPHAILGSTAELNTDVQIIDLTGCRADDVEIQPGRNDPGLEISSLPELDLGRHARG